MLVNVVDSKIIHFTPNKRDVTKRINPGLICSKLNIYIMSIYVNDYQWLKTRPNSVKNMVQQAKNEVPGFRNHYAKFEEQILVRGYSKSTLYNYSRAVAKIGLYYKKSILDLTSDEVTKFLYQIAVEKNAGSTFFKHTVFGLRFFYKIHGKKDILLELPKIRHERKLPVVMSKQELQRLFEAPKKLKQRVLFALIYSAGLRIGEVSRLKLSDVDFDRLQIRIIKSKGRYDRYVSLSSILINDLKRYIEQDKPHVFLFNGRKSPDPLGTSSIRQSFHHAVKKANIQKKVCVHTLRHSFATHMLEEGVDIVSIKEALGHGQIETTMLYLHVAKFDRKKAFSPLDTLYLNNN